MTAAVQADLAEAMALAAAPSTSAYGRTPQVSAAPGTCAAAAVRVRTPEPYAWRNILWTLAADVRRT